MTISFSSNEAVCVAEEPMGEVSFLRNLIQIGYLAVGDGRFADARAIFQGLIALRPENENPQLGLAVVEMSAGNYQAAAHAIDQARALNPLAPHLQHFEAVLAECCEHPFAQA